MPALAYLIFAVLAHQSKNKTNDPHAEVRQTLPCRLGSLVQIDRHQPHPAFELAGVVSRLSEATFVREGQGDIQAHGDEPVLGILHGALGGKLVAFVDSSRHYPFEHVSEHWGKGKNPHQRVVDMVAGQWRRVGGIQVHTQIGVFDRNPIGKALLPDWCAVRDGGGSDELGDGLPRDRSLFVAVLFVIPLDHFRLRCVHVSVPLGNSEVMEMLGDL